VIKTGIFDIFKKKNKTKNWAKMLSGQTPIFSQFGTDIYASDVVQQAVNCIVTEIAKSVPLHVISSNGINSTVKQSSIQRVLNHPNDTMTTSDFLEKITWSLFLNYNAFVLPAWNEERLIKLLPIQPTSVEFLEDGSKRLYVKFTFAGGENYTVRYSDVIHLRKNYSVNEFMGGDNRGQPTNTALLKTLEINDQLLQGVAKAINASFAVNAVVKYGTIIDEEKTIAAVKELEKKLERNQSGILPMDLKAEFIPISRDTKIVDADTLKFIDEKILRNFGVPLCILTGDYTKTQYEAFYQKTLEPILIKYSQAFTKALFSNRESFGYGNEIIFQSKQLQFMTMGEKLEMIRLLGDSGSIFENEKRTVLGMQPIPELDGVRKQSLNYVDTSIAAEYQLGYAKNKNKGGEEDEKDRAKNDDV
jgi:HK97 family phage portal protein